MGPMETFKPKLETEPILGCGPLRAPPKADPIFFQIIRDSIGADATGFSPIDGSGYSNDVMIASTVDGRFVIRTNSLEHLSKYEKEAWCLEQAHLVGIPVPRVIAFGTKDSKSYSIARYIEDSAPIDDRFDNLRVWKTLGSYMAGLNGIPVVGSGERMLSPGCFESSWQDVLNKEIAIVFRDNYFEEHGIFPKSALASLRHKLQECGAIDAKSGICHWDVSCANARIRNGNYDDIILLDLEFAIAAPVPHYQLACVAKPYGVLSREMTAFTSGYGLSENQLMEMMPDVKALVALKLMRSVRWGQDRRPEQVAGLAATARKTIISLLGGDLNLL
jgi:hypothetical protein